MGAGSWSGVTDELVVEPLAKPTREVETVTDEGVPGFSRETETSPVLLTDTVPEAEFMTVHVKEES